MEYLTVKKARDAISQGADFYPTVGIQNNLEDAFKVEGWRLAAILDELPPYEMTRLYLDADGDLTLDTFKGELESLA